MKISACLITRNEQHMLPECLGSLRSGFDEIVVCDTGSSDDTITIAQRAGANVVFEPWSDDFAAARNACKAHATGDWILWIDADERLMQGMSGLLRAIVEDPASQDPNLMALGVWIYSPLPTPGTAISDTVRIHRNRPEIVFEGRLHESIEASIRRLGGRATRTCIGILHEGYRNPDPGHFARNLRIAELDCQDRPESSLAHYGRARTLAALGKLSEAEAAFATAERLLADGDAWAEYVRRDWAALKEVAVVA